MLSHYQFESLSSSQDKAWQIIEREKKSEFSVQANRYTALRGRRGRSWEFHPNFSFCFSLALKVPSSHLSTLSITTGLLCVEYFKNLPLFLKWPNDIILSDQKVGGILVESRHFEEADSYAVIGVGLNQFAYSSYAGLGQRIEAKDFMETLYAGLQEYFETSFVSYKPRIENRLWRKGQRLKLTIGSEEKEVILKGIDDHGRLVTEHNGSINLEVSGELSFD